MKQYLSSNNFLVNNRHFVIKSSKETQLYDYIKNNFSSEIKRTLAISDSVQSHD